jgi:hypothetical protein
VSFPAGASTITVTGTFPVPVGGANRKGRVVFTPTAVLIDSTQHAIYSGGGPAAIVDGAMTATLLCNDDSDIKPTGWRWRVDEQPAGGAWRTYYIDLPSTLGSTVHLDQVAEVPAPDGGEGGAVGPQGPAGPTGPQGPTGATGRRRLRRSREPNQHRPHLRWCGRGLGQRRRVDDRSHQRRYPDEGVDPRGARRPGRLRCRIPVLRDAVHRRCPSRLSGRHRPVLRHGHQ